MGQRREADRREVTVELAPRTGLIGKPLSNDLVLPDDLTIDEWQGAVDHADMVVEASPWWLVSLMAYGVRRFGERHTQAFPIREEDPKGVKQSRLKQAAWMASIYPTASTRVPGLSYTHHRVVAELEPEDRAALLSEAVEANLSTRELLARVKEKQEQARAIPADSTPVCAAEAAWVPSLSDLLPEWRERLVERARQQPPGYTQGWLDALVATGNEAVFRPDRWRD